VREVIDGGPDSLAPERETDDYPTLAAWYSGFAYAEHYRKVVLAQCREIERAKAASSGTKTSEARLDDLARLHPIYLDFLATHLKGRAEWEAAFLAQGGLR
jgi:hypothetical protein